MSANPSDVPTRHDLDPIETEEWLQALEAVIEREGVERAHFLLERLIDTSRRSGGHIPFNPNTAYQHHSGAIGKTQPRRPRAGTQDSLPCPLERLGHGGQRQ